VSLWEGDEHTIRLVSGNQHTCALSNQGRVRCWGSNFGGELGYPEPFWVGYAGGGVPSDYGPVDIGGEVAELRAGKHGTCAILTDGALRCWGTNYFGSLGYGDGDAVGDDETPADAGDVPLGDAVASVALGATHTCAVLVDDSTWCWGSNLGGELGLGDFNIFGYPTPQLVPAAAPPAALALGAAFSCAIDEGGDVRCWGTGVEGQLANGTGEGFGLGPGETPGAAPTLDFGFPPAAQRLVAGDGLAGALLGPGSVHCWGAGADGQTGRAQTANLGDDPQELPLIVPVLLFPP
jgi:alpha-tubulin suppressor-like RCC1 family protein